METGEEPEVRKFKPRARWQVKPYRVRLADGTTYTLVESGEMSMDARILLYVQGSPGCGSREIVNHMGGRTQATLDAIKRLCAAGEMVNDGNDSRHRYRCSRTHPDPLPGKHVGKHPEPTSVSHANPLGEMSGKHSGKHIEGAVFPEIQTPGVADGKHPLTDEPEPPGGPPNSPEAIMLANWRARQAEARLERDVVREGA